MKEFFDRVKNELPRIDPIEIRGQIVEVVGLLIESTGPAASIGEVCRILNKNGELIVRAEVVGFRSERTLLMPLGTIEGVHPGNTVVATGKPLLVGVGDELLGRILNGIGQEMDGKGALNTLNERPIFSDIPDPLKRNRVITPFQTGIRAIDGFLTLGEGQRVGIFAGSGVGKSVLMGMMAKNCRADVNVIVLVGERGREVREFLERDLGEEGMKRSVVVVATSDQPALIRIKASMVGAAVAEYFRDQGKQVLFMCDSVTRLAMAQREIGLTIGEPPTTRGYTPSVFAMLPKFLERAGNSDRGSITGLFTVLVEGGDMDEPVADATRGILDGHILLSRELAQKNHFPAIDILGSISRCMVDVIDNDHRRIVGELRDVMSTYRANEDLISIGAYEQGRSPKIDKAIQLNDHINRYLRQDRDESATFEQARAMLNQLVSVAAQNERRK
ncbi:MAG: flagellar protein export ATPase FliI [Chitinispirillales bacterium]|jgi:flagellum-specific ATP synthase|nr:flagellar protein export ATPase FliI [Chitinispirillales bacterium]